MPGDHPKVKIRAKASRGKQATPAVKRGIIRGAANFPEIRPENKRPAQIYNPRGQGGPLEDKQVPNGAGGLPRREQLKSGPKARGEQRTTALMP